MYETNRDVQWSVRNLYEYKEPVSVVAGFSGYHELSNKAEKPDDTPDCCKHASTFPIGQRINITDCSQCENHKQTPPVY